MLRITPRYRYHEIVLVLYGKLIHPTVPIMEKEIRHHLARSSCLVLELDGLLFVDEDGLALLRQLIGRGLILRGGSPFVQALLAAEGMEVQQINLS